MQYPVHNDSWSAVQIEGNDLMPIVSMVEILADAEKKGYAVGCFNAINLDMIRGILTAAEQERAPVILCHAEVHFKYISLEKLVPVLVREAGEAGVPVALLLDHGQDFKTVVRAMKLGMNAVMYDGSNLAFEKNIERTAEIVRVARALGVSVEAELGHVTRPKGAGAEGNEDRSVLDDRSLYTDPRRAREFVERTGVDALAVAFGTAHGLYLKEPALEFSRLDEIHELVPVPLVMHGGSGLSKQDFADSISGGIRKINYYTGMAVRAAEEIRKAIAESGDEGIFYHHLMEGATGAICGHVRQMIRLFGSTGQA